MYNTRKEVDAHVRAAFAKIHSERERNLRSLTIARLYFKIHEYNIAKQYVSSYLSVKKDNDQAYKMLGLCYKHLKKPENALESFQNSLILNPKQHDVLIEVCDLLLNNDKFNSNKASYWCGLAEKEKIQHDTVFSLRLKLLNSGNTKGMQLEQVIQKEILARPHDVMLRVRLLRYYLEQNSILEAYQYIEELELSRKEEFLNSCEWYNVMWLILSKYESMANTKKDWKFWLLVIICLEHQLQIAFTKYQQNNPLQRIINNTATAQLNAGGGGGAVGGVGIVEIVNHLFTLDQYLFKVSTIANSFSVQAELVEVFLNHYRGQLLLHAVGLVFWRESFHTKNKWKETIRVMLPFLLLAYQSEIPKTTDPWVKHCDEEAKQLIIWWEREGSFRAIQAGRTLLSCLQEESSECDNMKLKNKPYLWRNKEELLDEVRHICADSQWRHNIFALLFNNSEHKLKESSSLLVKCPKLSVPRYEMPRYIELDVYEEAAQYLSPHSLKHMVYIGLTTGNLADLQAKYFGGLNFSTQNLSFCGAESLNQLDIDSFLYACVIQSKRALEIERKMDYYQQSAMDVNNDTKFSFKPQILPFVNLSNYLCTEEQNQWWHAAHTVYKNLSDSNDLATLRATIQYGIEAVRGVNGPKLDMIILFKMSEIFVTRAQNNSKPIQKSMLEARASTLYKYGLYMLKMHNKGILEPFVKYFKYSKGQTSDDERELVAIAENAVSYISNRYMKLSEYEELIEELTGLNLPLAAYMQAEAYRKLNETSKTPRKNKRMYIERARECLDQTMALLKDNNVNPNHPLNAVIASEIDRFHHINESPDQYFNSLNNSSRYEDAEADVYGEPLLQTPCRQLNSSRREMATTLLNSSHNYEMENLMKQMVSTLTSLRKEIFDIVKPELQTITKEIGQLKDKMVGIEDSIKKLGTQPSSTTTNPPSGEDTSNILDDYFIIEDALQQQLYQAQQSESSQHQNQLQQATGVSGGAQMANTMPPNGIPSQTMLPTNSPFMSQTPRMMPPKAIQQMINNYNNSPNAMGGYPPSGNFPYNFYGINQANPYIMPTLNPHAAGLAQQSNHALSMGGGVRPPHMAMSPYMDPNNPSMMNYQLQQSVSAVGGVSSGTTIPPMNASSQSTCGQLYNLLSQQPTVGPNIGAGNNALTNVSTATPNSLFNTGVAVTPTLDVSSNAATQQFNKNTSMSNQRRGNQQVEKTPPANVVITSSDPLPSPMSITSNSQQQQPALSVNIPAYHIKQSVVVGNQLDNNMIPPDSDISSTPTIKTSPALTNLIKAPVLNFNLPLATNNTPSQVSHQDITSTTSITGPSNVTGGENTFKFGSIAAVPTIATQKTEIYTGEEGAEEFCCLPVKLMRYNGKDGNNMVLNSVYGDIKIIKTKENTGRIVMRVKQNDTLCANHKITKDMAMKFNKSERECIWLAANETEQKNDGRLDKFSATFNTTDMAQKFLEAFIKAQNLDKCISSVVKSTANIVPSSTNVITAMATTAAASAASNTFSFTMGKGFMNSTPAVKSKTSTSGGGETTIGSSKSTSVLFASDKPMNSSVTSVTSTGSSSGNKASSSPFADFSFGNTTLTNKNSTSASTAAGATAANNTSNSSLFSGIFSGMNTSNVSKSSSMIPTSDNNKESSTPVLFSLNKSSASEPEDDYVPTAQFQPVISLPELVELKTGEENELVLFEHRAKLLRYNKAAGEWKERGIGNIKLLQNKNDVNKLRLVMRRDQVHKLCCNQSLSKSTKFNYAKNSEVAVNWVGQDFSEQELQSEVLTLRFKLPETCALFLKTIKEAQEKMTSTGTDDEIVTEAADSTTTVGQGQGQGQGGPMTLNEKMKAKTTATVPPPSIQGGFGNAFAPKAGSWNCEACYTNNGPDKVHCVACETPKDKTISSKKPELSLFGDTTTAIKPASSSKFTFGFALTKTNESTSNDSKDDSSTVSDATTIKTSGTVIGFGDQFKPKVGAWTCQACYLSNNGDLLHCQACNTSKDGSSVASSQITTTNNTALGQNKPLQKFTFGFNATTTSGVTPAVSTATTSSSSLSFDFSTLTTTQTPAQSQTSLLQKASESSGKSFTFTKPFATSTTFSSDGGSLGKDNQNVVRTFNFGTTTEKDTGDKTFNLDKKDFSFTLKPKSPGKTSKSPVKFGSGGGGGGDADLVCGDADGGDGTYADEEENNTYFTPVIPLPDKVAVKTGEEDEEVLYVHRAKLFRFASGDWKERGVGNVKILRHRETKKLRVVMRRDQVLKICLNHVLNEDVSYSPKDDQSWFFVVNDFSEGEMALEKFSIRFKKPDIAKDFMTHIQKALDGTAVPIQEVANNTIANVPTPNKNETANISASQKEEADNLLLPYEFYTEKQACSGCRGCTSEEFKFPVITEEFINKQDGNEDNLPLELPLIKGKSASCIPKKSVFLSALGTAQTTSTAGGGGLFSGGLASGGGGGVCNFSFTDAMKECENVTTKVNVSESSAPANESNTTPKSLFQMAAPKITQDKPTLFGGTGSSIFDGKPMVFGSLSKPLFGTSLVQSNNNNNTNSSTTNTGGSNWIFGGTTFGSASTQSPVAVTNANNIGSTTTNNTGITSGFSLFGNIESTPLTTTVSSCEGTTNTSTTTTTTTTDNNTTAAAGIFPDLGKTAVASLSFTSLASGFDKGQTNNNPLWLNTNSGLSGKPKPPAGGFFGLQQINDAFACNKKENTGNRKNENEKNQEEGEGGEGEAGKDDDANYDPHYEPIIEMPDEIVVTTGEENEEKIFGERAVLYRYSESTKEWKERGVGELKLLKHSINHSYRLVMRREQIHKLVLNHAVNAEFHFKPFNNNVRSFCWRTTNFAETNDGVLETLTVRFSKEEVAQRFKNILNKCLSECQSRDNTKEENVQDDATDESDDEEEENDGEYGRSSYA